MAQREVPEWFAFYPYDFMGDENVIAMTLEERGAYITLLCQQWANGSIPADVPALARILKRTTEEMETLWPAIAPCFPSHPELDFRLANARLEVERELTIKRIKGASKGGKTSAERRAKSKSTSSQPEVNLNLGSSQQAVNPYVVSCNVVKDSKKEATGENCDTFRELYPAHRLDNYGAQCFISSDDQAGILDRLRLAVKSEDWTRENGRYVPKASKWVLDGAPAPAAQPTPASAPASVVSTMDPETARRIREARNGA
jgi:uncharacterized protein YdaU (DUF1376 family)